VRGVAAFANTSCRFGAVKELRRVQCPQHHRAPVAPGLAIGPNRGYTGSVFSSLLGTSGLLIPSAADPQLGTVSRPFLPPTAVTSWTEWRGLG
jgi:hypothetical protein